ncbi:NgoMIV family type II restriction endonuclease [Brachybacterium phenoliresistens]|uniref:NgoMIV family type II restriction endonuclease n=1 Tax=Brachybacterium phenoliresistens TaxID=396014 RepID=UPI0031D05C58
MSPESFLSIARSSFHAGLLEGTLTVDSDGIASNADRGNAQSRAYSAHIARALKQETVHERAAGQTLGGSFEKAVVGLLNETFPRFDMLRPGEWEVRNLGSARKANHIAQYEPYTHLGYLDQAVTDNPQLLAVLGNAYAIAPDVIVSRAPVPDDVINSDAVLVDSEVGNLSPIRLRRPGQSRILHAVISCKWTLRSDRAQNARSEALNLVRNRKGRTPHIVVVTGEPTPSRISSLALGTGDIDTVYHFALPELKEAVNELGTDESRELLSMMVEGQRLRDIADLPLDLSV